MNKEEEKKLEEWMLANYKEHLLNCAEDLEHMCRNTECKECPFCWVYSGDVALKCELLHKEPASWDIERIKILEGSI